MMDGSLGEDGKTPPDYDYNVRVTRNVVDLGPCLRRVGGRRNRLPGFAGNRQAGEEDGVGAEGVLDHSQLLTDPEEAAQFVKDTGVDALAIAIGTSHGAYKFTRPPTGDILAIERVKAINKPAYPNTHLVMHGSSSVPQEWLKRHQRVWRRHQGNLWRAGGADRRSHQARRAQGEHRHRPASGRPLGAIRRYLAKNPAEFDPRKYLKETRRRHARHLHPALRSLRYGWSGQQDQGSRHWRP
jgi:fructose-bisphosphate aldolase class II